MEKKVYVVHAWSEGFDKNDGGIELVTTSLATAKKEMRNLVERDRISYAMLPEYIKWTEEHLVELNVDGDLLYQYYEITSTTLID